MVTPTALFVEYGQTLAIAEPSPSPTIFWPTAAGARRSDARTPAPTAPAAAAQAPTPGAGFLDRLPPRLGRELLCLQMEDHYVRAHTRQGLGPDPDAA